MPTATKGVSQEILDKYRIHNDTYYHKELPLVALAIIEQCRTTHSRIRLHYGDLETGRDYLEEHDIKGKIGRSIGPVKVPLLVPVGGDGGPELFSHIVKISLLNGDVLYKHPNWHLPKIEERPCVSPDLVKQGYKYEVLVEGEIHARFKTLTSLDVWYKLIAGPGCILRKLPGGVMVLEQDK